jgi:hypothetical protein
MVNVSLIRKVCQHFSFSFSSFFPHFVIFHLRKPLTSTSLPLPLPGTREELVDPNRRGRGPKLSIITRDLPYQPFEFCEGVPELTLVDKVCFGVLEIQAFHRISMHCELNATLYNGRHYTGDVPGPALSLPSWRSPPTSESASKGRNVADVMNW